MEGPPLGPGGEDITWPDQVAPRGRKASSTRKIKPQTSNLTNTAITQFTIQIRLRAFVQHTGRLTVAGMYKNCTKEESPEIGI